MRITGSDPVMREDVVKVGRGSTDLRYRPMFIEWSAMLRVTYITSVLTLDSVASLIGAGGMGMGIGEWRPQRGGAYGTYEVDDSKRIKDVED